MVIFTKRIKIFILIFVFLFIFLGFDFYFSNKVDAFENKFIIEKDCPLYKFENEKFLKIAKNNKEKSLKLNSENFESKDIKQFKRSKYVLLKNHEKQFNILDDFYININCGYFKIENENNKVKFDKKFLENDEVEIIKKNIKDIDKEIVSLCGPLGSHPSKSALKEIILSHEREFRQIYIDSGKTFFGVQLDFEKFIDEIIGLLFKNHGFEHVFCGSLRHNSGKIAGPHYAYRFLDLNQRNLIGFMENDQKKKNMNIKKFFGDEKIFINRSMSFIDHLMEVRTKYENSFIMNDNFFDLLKIILKIGKIDYSNVNLKEKKDISSCIFHENTEKDQKKKIYQIVFSLKNKSLITIYPIALDEANKEKDLLCKFI